MNEERARERERKNGCVPGLPFEVRQAELVIPNGHGFPKAFDGLQALGIALLGSGADGLEGACVREGGEKKKSTRV